MTEKIVDENALLRLLELTIKLQNLNISSNTNNLSKDKIENETNLLKIAFPFMASNRLNSEKNFQLILNKKLLIKNFLNLNAVFSQNILPLHPILMDNIHINSSSHTEKSDNENYQYKLLTNYSKICQYGKLKDDFPIYYKHYFDSLFNLFTFPKIDIINNEKKNHNIEINSEKNKSEQHSDLIIDENLKKSNSDSKLILNTNIYDYFLLFQDRLYRKRLHYYNKRIEDFEYQATKIFLPSLKDSNDNPTNDLYSNFINKKLDMIKYLENELIPGLKKEKMSLNITVPNSLCEEFFKLDRHLEKLLCYVKFNVLSSEQYNNNLNDITLHIVYNKNKKSYNDIYIDELKRALSIIKVMLNELLLNKEVKSSFFIRNNILITGISKELEDKLKEKELSTNTNTDNTSITLFIKEYLTNILPFLSVTVEISKDQLTKFLFQKKEDDFDLSHIKDNEIIKKVSSFNQHFDRRFPYFISTKKEDREEANLITLMKLIRENKDLGEIDERVKDFNSVFQGIELYSKLLLDTSNCNLLGLEMNKREFSKVEEAKKTKLILDENIYFILNYMFRIIANYNNSLKEIDNLSVVSESTVSKLVIKGECINEKDLLINSNNEKKKELVNTKVVVILNESKKNEFIEDIENLISQLNEEEEQQFTEIMYLVEEITPTTKDLLSNAIKSNNLNTKNYLTSFESEYKSIKDNQHYEVTIIVVQSNINSSEKILQYLNKVKAYSIN